MHAAPVDLEPFRARIASVAPDLARLPLTAMSDGWDSLAIDAGGAWVFKFPRHAAGTERLRREARLLSLVRRHVSLQVPELVLHEGDEPFSQHRKIPGRSLESADYARLDALERDALAETLAVFYAELHAIPVAEAEAAGAPPGPKWMPASEILERVRPTIPAHLRDFLETTMAAYDAIPADDATIYGYFDGHGWNMAFDHEAGRLNGCYDFADSGIGPRHQDLSYTNWIARDLTLRIIARYERLAGIEVNRDRVMLYSAALRFDELAHAFGDPADRLRAVEDWAKP
jgi:aminoglycoside phosphotransferase (APT) family kinase protein